MIYLDHNATTPVLPEVLEAMLPFLREQHGNPSSTHALGIQARKAVDDARAQVAELIGCFADEIVFTSSGTEANNLAIRGICDEPPTDSAAIVTSTIEHPATLAPCELLALHGWRVRKVPVDHEGRILIDEARRTIAVERVRLVTVMHSNNETGVLQPVEEIVPLARAARAFIHVDAAQSVGKVAINVRLLDVDLLSIAGHKLYAPKGVGALYVRRAVRNDVHPFLRGAGQEAGLRPGTENVAGIVGLGAAAAIALRDLHREGERQRALRDELHALLKAKVTGLKLSGHATLRLPNTLNVRFPNARGSAVLAACPTIAASTGSACHELELELEGTGGGGGGDGSGERARAQKETASSVLLAMDVAPLDALGAVRLTVGRGTGSSDVRQAADALSEAWLLAGRR